MRIPILTHNCDDLEIEHHGGSYKPHPGEDVWFISYISAPDMLTILSLSDSEDSTTVLGGVINDISPILAKVIDSWTWTDARTEKPLGKKDGARHRPTETDIASLSHQEIMYLVNAFIEETQGDGNPQSASLEKS